MVKEDGRIIDVLDEPSWDDVEKYTKALAETIQLSGFEPDYLVGISIGGWVPAVLLHIS